MIQRFADVMALVTLAGFSHSLSTKPPGAEMAFSVFIAFCSAAWLVWHYGKTD